MSDRALEGTVGPFGLAHAPTAPRLARKRQVAFAVLFAIALLPVLTTPIPAMVDYVNHLARMYLLAADGTPGASRFYYVSGSFYPNLAMDLVVPRVGRFVGIELAARLFLLVTQVLIVTGAVAIELAVKRRFEISGFVALLMLDCVPFAWGFLNFEFALALALWGIAAWLALRGRTWTLRLAIHAVFVGLLFVSHLFALGLYGVVLGLHELWAARATRAAPARTAATMLMLGAPALIVAGIMAWSGGAVGQAVNQWDFGLKPLWLFMLLNGYSAVFSCVGTSILVVAVYALARQRGLRLESSGVWLGSGLALLYVVVPARLLDTAFVDIRVLVAAALILPAFVGLAAPRAARPLGAIVVALTLVNTGITQWVWGSYQPEYRAMIASFGRLGHGASVLVAASGEGRDPPMLSLDDYPMYHAPTLAAAYAGAFVPTLFTTVGKQPIAIRAAYRRLAYSCGGPVPMATLAALADGRPPPETPDFARDWPRDFDYIYAVGAPAANPMPALLEPLETHARFTLYRVRHDGARPALP